MTPSSLSVCWWPGRSARSGDSVDEHADSNGRPEGLSRQRKNARPSQLTGDGEIGLRTWAAKDGCVQCSTAELLRWSTTGLEPATAGCLKRRNPRLRIRPTRLSKNATAHTSRPRRSWYSRRESNSHWPRSPARCLFQLGYVSKERRGRYLDPFREALAPRRHDSNVRPPRSEHGALSR